MSNLINKVKDAVTGHKDRDTTGTQSTTSSSNPNYYDESGSTNAGPHDTNVANKLDPRVDSDRDGSRTVGTGNTYGSNTGTGTTMGTTGQGYTSTGYGPHDSSLANKMDPRVDSTTGATNTRTMGNTGTTGMTGMTGMTGSGYNQSTNYGPHDSNLANKLDPRVDSDRDGSRTAGTTYGTGMGSTTGNQGTMSGMTGQSKTTAGPHNSDLANKLDPRVDSDLDGSRTVGSGPKYGNY
ncbi:hypothetical protein ABW19_dt0203284 [Dactylella cylindrospora]|nr:hypothetical protein ABW19_dt0203284 [Dactylella cylindrospora]